MIKKLKLKIGIGGFTVLETIVSLAVLSLAISGAFSAVRTGLYANNISKEETKAYYLADEAVEIIRNKRDSNVLSNLLNSGSTSWLAGIADNSSDPCFPGKTCRVDATGPGGVFLTSCPGGWGSCPALKQDGTSYLYQYSTGPDTIYKREIQIEKPSATEIDVSVQITWNHGGISKQFKVKTILTNWF